ncbi:MAG: hypothetical protein V2J24_22435 [Pseudomonadales bacterium]|jgi:uncharacterized repeat protein (TIGR01451 family)|nr:hypothetical protein [Pseudomonadales bacterium]
MNRRTVDAILRLLVLLAPLFATVGARGADSVVLSVNRVTLEGPSSTVASVTRIAFQQPYATTPAVFVLPDERNPDPSTIRVLAVDTTGFDVAVLEPPGEDGRTASTSFDYFAVEPFARNVAGVEMEAGILSGFATEEGRFIAGGGTLTIDFARGKSGTPVVLAQLQSAANQPGIPLQQGSDQRFVADPWMTALVERADASGFELAIERSEDSGALANPETIAYFAIDADVDFDFLDAGGTTVQARSTRTADVIVGHDNGCVGVPLGRSFAGTPRVFGSKNSRDGGDGGWLRRCESTADSVSLVVDEDRINDGERAHTTERAGLLSFQRDFTARRVAPRLAEKPFDGEVGSGFIPAASGSTARFTRVSFPNPFDPGVTPLVFTLPTEGDTAPATLRIRDVDRTGFDVAAVEPEGELGAHEAMTIDYVAVEAGTHRLDDGRRVEAGFVDSRAQQGTRLTGTSWDSIRFGANAFDAPPALLTQIQTVANEPTIDPSGPSVPFLTSVVRTLDATGAEIALERSETIGGSVTVDERIAWFAAERGVRGTLVARDGTPVAYDFAAGAEVQGFDDGCDAVAFDGTFVSPPLAVADKNARNGNNGGWLRRCSPPGTTSIGLHVDEDRAGDAERTHIGEPVSVFAFERAFDWCPSEPEILLSKSSLVSADPVNGTSSPKRIPGALIDYTITARNADKAATDPDSVVVTDTLPPGLALFLGDLGSGSPFQFVDGDAASGLAFEFIAVDSPVDGVEFTDDASANPLDWSYQPVVVDGFDPRVEAFRIRLTGALAGQRGATAPSFSLRYRARVD